MTTVVRGGTTIKRLRSAGTLTMNLLSTKSLVQATNGTSVLVDWTVEANQPTVYPTVRSSKSTELIYDYVNVVWKYDGSVITEDDSRFDTTKTYTMGAHEVPCLIIKDNLGLSITSSKLITCDATVKVDGFNEVVSSDIEVSTMEASPTTYIGEIGMTNGGVISSEADTITLNTVLTQGGNLISNYEVEWYRVVANDTDGEVDGLEALGKTGKTITLDRNDIDLMETIVAKFKVGESIRSTKSVDVRDETDPYVLIFNHSTPGGYLDEVNGVTTTAQVVTRDNNQEVPLFTYFAFSLMNGLVLVRNQAKSTNNKFKTEKSDFDTGNVDELYLQVEATES